MNIRGFFSNISRFAGKATPQDYNALQQRLSRCEFKIIEHEEALLRIKRMIKRKKREKFNIVFLCYRPSVWKSLQTVYEAFAADNDFNVTILAVRYRDGKNFIDEGAYSFFKNLHYNVVDGYNEQTGEGRELCEFDPDFIFYQTPHERRYAAAYETKRVARYAAVGYVHYALHGRNSQISYRLEFTRNCSLIFADTESRRNVVRDFIIHVDDPRARQICFTGHPKLDFLKEEHPKDATPWKSSGEHDLFRILWTPRWSDKEGCCFFPDYKDLLFSYAQHHKNVELVFRPHPIALRKYVADHLFTEEELQRYLDLYTTSDRAVLDTVADYHPAFASSSVLVADYTSLMAEYLFTGKPIVYCHRADVFNDEFRLLAQVFYWAHTWPELEKTLDMLRSGEDPLAERRKELAASLFHRPPGGAGRLIKELVKRFLTGNWDSRLANGEPLFAAYVPEGSDRLRTREK